MPFLFRAHLHSLRGPPYPKAGMRHTHGAMCTERFVRLRPADAELRFRLRHPTSDLGLRIPDSAIRLPTSDFGFPTPPSDFRPRTSDSRLRHPTSDLGLPIPDSDLRPPTSDPGLPTPISDLRPRTSDFGSRHSVSVFGRQFERAHLPSKAAARLLLSGGTYPRLTAEHPIDRACLPRGRATPRPPRCAWG
jgi:hypothetical protein